jgi:hypothetical protein
MHSNYMKTFDFIQATISNHLKDPHSKALEPNCLSPYSCDYDTASSGEREGVRGIEINSVFGENTPSLLTPFQSRGYVLGLESQGLK